MILSLVFGYESFAQFGKNKVQYEKFEWKYIQSTHYDIYYDAGSKYLAEFAAITAEEALAEYSELVNYRSSGRSAIIIYNSHNQFQQTNAITSYMPEGVGGVTELYKNRVILPFQGDYAIFHHVIRHELIHSIINFMFYGGTYQTAISTQGVRLPLWMNEGLAEYASRGGLDTQTDMFMRDLVIGESLPPLNRIRGYLAYRAGQMFYWYIEQKYGKDKIADLLHAVRLARSMDAAFQDVFKIDFEEFSEQWQDDLKKMYFPDLPKYENPKDFAVRLTNQKKDKTYYNSSPAISPDGEKMAYISAPEGIYAVYVRDIDDKESTEKIITSMRSQDFEDLNLLTPGISWSPDSKKIAISAKAGSEDAIYIVDPETKDYERIKLGFKSITSVQWSPDGQRLAFVASKVEKSDIYIYQIEDEILFNLTDDVFTNNVPMWSPDSEQIYFISDRGDYLEGDLSKDNIKMWYEDVYKSDIYRMTISNSQIERLTFDPGYSKISLAVAHDNSKVIYSADNNGISNLYELNIENGNIRPLTNSITAIEQISLSNDSHKLLFTALTKGGMDIYMLRHPLEQKIEGDTIPLTELRRKELNEIRKAELIEDKTKELEEAEPEELKGYGEFDIDFSRQTLVEDNPDAKRRQVNNKEEIKIADNSARIDGEFIEYDYKIKFSPDVVSANPGFSTYYGFQGVSQVLFSDKLGDHRIYLQFNIFRDLKNSSIFASYNYLPGLYDWSFRGYQRAGYINSYYPLEVQQETGYAGGYYRYRNLAGGFTVSRPISIFQRFEAGLDAMYIIKENYSYPQYEDNQNAFLLVPTIKAVYDNTLYGYYGPNRGFRGFIEAKGSPKLGSTGAEFISLKTDLRYYQPIGNYLSLAFRGSAGASFGANAQQFYLGGQEMWLNYKYKDGKLPVNSPVDFAFMEFQMPMRGYAVGEIAGSKYFLGNAEFRFPLITALIAGPIPVLIQGIQACVFYDIGGAYNTQFHTTTIDPLTGEKIYDDLLMSTGFGVRAAFLGIPWKFDMAWQKEYTGWSKPQYIWSIGFDF